ncbi:MAG TPA: hypothetical protein VFS14_02430 [Candidatus Saccharimonadales bacterium]|nr:hypothetical protein [Candidatus Saccharimonadales bacterium]
MPVALLVLLVGVGAALVVAGGFKAYDAVVRFLEQPRLPARSIGSLPPSGQVPNSHGRWQLRRATVIVAQLCEVLGLQSDTEQLLRQWLEDCKAEQADEARLLSAVAVLLMRVESEDRLIPTASEALRDATRDWLDEYLNRRENRT